MKHETSIAEELYVCVLFLLDIRFQIHIGYSKFHSGERIQKVADSSAGFTGCVWTEAESARKEKVADSKISGHVWTGRN